MCTWSMINVWGATGELCNEERAHNAGLPIPRTAGMPIVSEACCAYSDFVNWISAFFFLQDQSLLVCHAGHVVIEQKIESEKEEIGRRRWRKTWQKEKWANEGRGWTRGEWGDEREGRWVRDRSRRAHRKHTERWRDEFDWTNEKSSADRNSRAKVRDGSGRQKMWWKERRGQLSSAACYSRCHLFQLLLISAWTYLLGRKLNIDLFFSLHSNPHPLFLKNSASSFLIYIEKTPTDRISNVIGER